MVLDIFIIGESFCLHVTVCVDKSYPEGLWWDFCDPLFEMVFNLSKSLCLDKGCFEPDIMSAVSEEGNVEHNKSLF